MSASSSSTGRQSQISRPRSVLRQAKYPLFQRLSFLAGPLPNLGHDERLAQWIEHSIGECLTPRAPVPDEDFTLTEGRS